jgi:hypothetical protein
MKKQIFNNIQSQEDGNYLTESEGRIEIMALARVYGWTGSITALELDSWSNRF